ncbi:putative membrane protein [Acinetobacter baumannii 348935]|nr:putative membrane protein [Acinetobacter baumannii 348935]
MQQGQVLLNLFLISIEGICIYFISQFFLYLMNILYAV